jgi:signal transduction histidine kinase
MNEGVIAADTQQRILFTNESAGRLLGFGAGTERDEVAGRLLWEVVRSDAVQKLARDVLSPDAPRFGNGDATDPPGPSTLAGRTTIHVGPLLGRHLEITACTFPLDGRPEGLILVAHDATQSVQYQELRKEFVANVSHELRTPLSIIKGFAETLRDGAMADPSRAAQYLATIEKHADQLTNLVSDLLELSRLDSQVGITRRAPVNVAALIRHVGELLLPVAQRKRHDLSIDLSPDLPETLGNVDYLERAVTNLIDNAIKYTPEGGRISVVASSDNGSVLIEVTDNGIGIPAGELPRIFERFYRVDRSRSRELGGTGLGLSIVKHVAQTHGGSIEVDSAPGGGSTFRLRLPANEDSTSD